MRALKYAFHEAFISIWRDRASSMLSVAAIAAALLIFSAFLLFTTNLERLLAGWSSGAELSIYLTDAATETERTAIERLLNEHSDVVDAREYVSKSEAQARFKREFQDLAGVAASLEENPFPASFEIRVDPDAARSDAVTRLTESVAALPGVADVRYDRRWLERLGAAITVMRGVVAAFALILIFGAALTVSNVVRLAFQTRRDEIEIMQLVGAPASFVRGPFLAEGIVQGGAGALMALLALGATYLVARQRFGPTAFDALGVDVFGFLPLQFCAGIFVGGMLVGCLGGLLATWGLGTAVPTAQPIPASDAI